MDKELQKKDSLCWKENCITWNFIESVLLFQYPLIVSLVILEKKKKEKVIFTIDSQLANNTHNDIEAKKQCYIIR